MPHFSGIWGAAAAQRGAPGPVAGRPAPRVLLLTSTLGCGHLRAAQAIETALLSRYPELRIQTLDLWSLMDEGVADRLKRTYLRLTQEYPELYERIYRIDQTAWRRVLRGVETPLPDLAEASELLANAGELRESLIGPFEGRHALDRLLARVFLALLRQRPGSSAEIATMLGALIRLAWLGLVGRLDRRVRAFRPDVAVATQMVPAALFSLVKKRRRLAVPLIGIITDFGIHDFWLQSGIDRYCVAHDSIEGLDDAGCESARVVPTGIPLMPDFGEPPGRCEAREQLRLPPHDPVVLVLGGGLGLGVEAMTARLLQKPGRLQVLALPGKNHAGQQSLALQLARHPGRLRIWDWTDRVALLLRAADLVVGKPGGLTVAEALACGRPLFAARSLGGQEGFNTRFLERHGVGALTSEDGLVERVSSLLASPGELAAMQDRAWRLGRRHAAGRVAELVAAAASAAGQRELVPPG